MDKEFIKYARNGDQDTKRLLVNFYNGKRVIDDISSPRWKYIYVLIGDAETYSGRWVSFGEFGNQEITKACILT